MIDKAYYQLRQKLSISNNIYEGIIVDSNDPLMKSRVKVSIPFLTDKLDITLLPWYIVIGTASSASNSQVSVPPINCRVLVQFFDNDIYNGTVIGAIPAAPAN